MTCIVGIKTEAGDVVIGGDAAGVGGLSLQMRDDPKVFARGEIIMGGTGSFRMIQLLRFSLDVPPFPEGLAPYEWAVTKLVPAVRTCLKDGGFAKKNNEVESIDGALIVGVRGHLLAIEGDYQVGEQKIPFNAVGCGHDIAKGAVAAMWARAPAEDLDAAREMIEHAIEIAEAFSAGVRTPVEFVEISGPPS